MRALPPAMTGACNVNGGVRTCAAKNTGKRQTAGLQAGGFACRHAVTVCFLQCIEIL